MGQINKILNLNIILFVVLALKALGVEDGVAINLKNNTTVSIQSTEVNSIYNVTSEEFQSNFEEGIQLLRKKGEGWNSSSETLILLDVLSPIKMESEIDNIYIEGVTGDKLIIDDIGFRVQGDSNARVTFKFSGSLFKIPGYATMKQLDESPFLKKPLGETLSKLVVGTSGINTRLEIDLYLDLENVKPNNYSGTITAIAEYE